MKNTYEKMLDTLEYDPYSPKTLVDLVGNTPLWNDLAKQINEEKTSHLVLCGPAGCGKSSFLRMVLQGKPVLRIDCTANAGLRDSRDSIRAFAKGGRTATGQFRWILLEHADSLHADTQAFLRRMLETTAAHTRMVFEVRDVGAITEPLLSRSTLVNVRAPEETEVIYEILRRTNFELEKSIVHQIAKECRQNIRVAVLEALVRWKKIHTESIGHSHDWILPYLDTRPKTKDLGEWNDWALSIETVARSHGIDLRDILLCGWPHHPIVSQSLAQWSRLGGTSCRALFFSTIYDILQSAEHSSK